MLYTGLPNTQRSLAPPPRPGVRPVVRPRPRPKAKKPFTYMDSTYLGDQNQLQHATNLSRADINAGLAALARKDPFSGRTLYGQALYNANTQRKTDGSVGHAGLAGRGILFSGARDNMDSGIASEYVKRQSDAYNTVGQGARAELLQQKQQLQADFIMQLQALQAAAAQRAREAGGPAIPRGRVGYRSVGAA